MTSATTTVAAPGGAFSLKPLLFTAGVGSLSMMAFVAVVGPMARLLGLQPWHVGAAVTAAGVAWMLMARFWGVRSDQIGRRKVLLIALAGFAVSYAALGLFMNAALALVPAAIISFLGMTAARTAAGAFYAAVPPVCAAVVADHTPPAERARAMGAVGAASALGMVVGPGAAGLLAGWSLSAALMIISALPVLAFIAVWRFLPADAPHETRRKSVLKLSDVRIPAPSSPHSAPCAAWSCVRWWLASWRWTASACRPMRRRARRASPWPWSAWFCSPRRWCCAG
ncbi:MFS transporter [Brevundimonas sp. LPMIX5]|uniref:MFS transporter n=1 Tax=Brevundimonas sp. LPMIX5 TaxID=2305887 RepID=UPI0018F783AC|nr:MFS transporter [Brevundimonas sp. LPMIX5]